MCYIYKYIYMIMIYMHMHIYDKFCPLPHFPDPDDSCCLGTKI